MKKKSFITNDFGQKIVACCASCAFHAATNEEHRSCQKGYGKVSKDFLCAEHYQMAKYLNKAGKAGGRVKRKEYLQWLAANMKEGSGSLLQLRSEWEQEHGQSIYLSK